MPGESDGFHANPKYCAVPMSGSAGVIAIIQVNLSPLSPSLYESVSHCLICFNQYVNSAV